jgi:hypothetical protein
MFRREPHRSVLAYRSTIPDDLRKALGLLLGDAGYRERCFEGLRIAETEPILEGAAQILRDLEL